MSVCVCVYHSQCLFCPHDRDQGIIDTHVLREGGGGDHFTFSISM